MTGQRPGRLSPSRFEHAGLRTAQLDRMVDWYCAVLGAEVAFRNSAIAFIRYDERNHRLALIARPGTQAKAEGSAGLDHLAFAYADREDLGHTYWRLAASGIEPQRSTDHGSSLSLYYDDPDGNQIELKVDSFASDDEQVAWLSSPEFAANPLGEPIRPAEAFSEFRPA